MALGAGLRSARRCGSGATITYVIAELLDALTHAPNLRGAACAGRPELFDVRDGDDRAQAVCAACPALAACRSWVDSLPKPLRPSGVIAGRYVPAPRPRPDYIPRPRRPRSREVAADW